MKNYKRLMLGAKSSNIDECLNDNFIGVNFTIQQDLTGKLHENWRDFHKQFNPIWQAANPGKSKVSAGLACGMLWTICKGMNVGDIVICPDSKGRYHVATIESEYYYKPATALPHRRAVNWLNKPIDKSQMSKELQSSCGSIGTVSDISKHAAEIETLIGPINFPAIVTTDATIEDVSVFALEKHLEEFLVQNWKHLDLGKEYDIYEEDGTLVGRQYQCDTGIIDILAISKDKKCLLVVELKRGRASDNVVGQILRYMGFAKEVLAEKHQEVKGVIIGLEDDNRLKRALSATSNIEFYRYKVNFKLFKS